MVEYQKNPVSNLHLYVYNWRIIIIIKNQNSRYIESVSLLFDFYSAEKYSKFSPKLTLNCECIWSIFNSQRCLNVTENGKFSRSCIFSKPHAQIFQTIMELEFQRDRASRAKMVSRGWRIKQERKKWRPLRCITDIIIREACVNETLQVSKCIKMIAFRSTNPQFQSEAFTVSLVKLTPLETLIVVSSLLSPTQRSRYVIAIILLVNALARRLFRQQKDPLSLFYFPPRYSAIKFACVWVFFPHFCNCFA